ncbi:hypothetical protein BX616_009911 [Lobosporangium transversale]|uniref:Uncharacterized protein n=1 Tax=Lobosporangium transversale TaxID=64571 RepID=A0A1Y2GQT3_9FUNG|nr:hypothetical protein BCR41DRAFT_386270 [Lobosporangium transversale]KAF9913526.1 hypothetical protein BX616_009911 [Lobosporangium transversale]ORZ16686.1 hypothetical protein BCR41DRAFT_386270 [Lobosporangium transversale]|eukprot:XP_021881621.1 hypothetical protein BCR41DRAFT_386270 [Lobosporangium transversale]
MVSFRNIFLSETQRQVEAEARNIGLAHTIRDLITGANHEIHVDSYQKKKAVKALQKAKPAQVNELITILKAMPDPTVGEFKTVHNREHSKQQQHSIQDNATRMKIAIDSSDHGESSLNDKANQKVDNTNNASSESELAPDVNQQPASEPESDVIKAPSSWWAISFSSLMTAFASSTSPKEQPSVRTTTTTITTITMAEEDTEQKERDEVKPPVEGSSTDSTTKTTAQTGSTDSAESTKNTENIESNSKKGTVTKTTTSSTTIATNATADKTTLVSTINSIKQQVLALTKAPPNDVISAYTYWWGYEIYVPHNCMAKLQRVTNTSQIFFGFLSGAVSGIPGLAALVPLSRIISAWVGFQWALIQAEDLGKGVVLSATWVLPVALAPRSWDYLGTEDVPAPAGNPVTKKQKQIKAA